jgi:hypothetical protein
LNEFNQAIEEIVRIVRSCGSFRMILDRVSGDVDALKALDNIVVEGNMANLNPSETSRRINFRTTLDLYGEAVIVCCDLNFAGTPV